MTAPTADAAHDRGLGRLRLTLLRLAYVPLALGLAWFQLPQLASLGPGTQIMDGVVTSMLGALCLLSFIGLFRPIVMLPLLMFEVMWKLIWLALVGIPASMAGPLRGEMAANLFAVALIVPIIALIPWDFVFASLLRSPSDRPAGRAGPI